MRTSGCRLLLVWLLAVPPLLTIPSPVSAEEPDSPPSVVAEALGAFDQKIRELRQGFAERPAAPEDAAWVREKLAHMVEVDQYMRNYFSLPYEKDFTEAQRQEFSERFMPRWQEVDETNTAELKELLEIHGWFTISQHGKEADDNAWLLVQHADRDPDFQRHVLGILEQLVAENETSPRNYAYLYDRVASAEGRPQRYGTQGRCVGPGEWQPNTLEDPEKIDEVRASVGLKPLEEYKKAFVDICH